MALISLRQMLDHAAEHDYGVPAFNVNNLEQMRAIMLAADQTDSPVIWTLRTLSTSISGWQPRSCTRAGVTGTRPQSGMSIHD